MTLLLLQLLLPQSVLLLLLLLMTGVVLLQSYMLLLDIKLLVVQLLLLMTKLLLLMWLLLRYLVVHIAILVLVAPHWTAAVTEQPIGLRHLAHGGSVILAMLLWHYAASTTTNCAPVTRKGLPCNILRLNTNVVTHRLTVSGHDLLGRNWWHCVLVLPWAQRLHLEGLKVSTEVQLIHK